MNQVDWLSSYKLDKYEDMSSNIRAFETELLVSSNNIGTSHRIIQLPNGLLTLLVSNPSEDLSSVALCVASGSNNDPIETLGLAHLCEHLILLGSKKFPDPNLFHDELTLAGGSRNAFTTNEQSCFFMEVPSTSMAIRKNGGSELYFNNLLEIFANAFIDPLFRDEVFDKEIFAVDSEHSANKSSTQKILYHCLRLISNESHPFHKFGTGNFSTLHDGPALLHIKVKGLLSSYFENNFTADKMTLVIKSSQSLNFLQKLASTYFSGIRSSSAQDKLGKLNLFTSWKQGDPESSPNEDRELDQFDISSVWSYDTSVFTPMELNNCILVQSVNNPVVRLNFPIRYDPKEKSTRDLKVFGNAWSNIVGNEAVNSLDSILKRRGYIVGLNAFVQNLARGESVLVMELKLTNSGISKIVDILNFVFGEYQEVFQDHVALGEYLSELEVVEYLNFTNNDEHKSPKDECAKYACTLQENLSILGTKNVLKNSYNWDEIEYGFDENSYGKEFFINKGFLFRKFIRKVFSLGNFLLCFVGAAHQVDGSMLLNRESESKSKTDAYFGFDYMRGKFNRELMTGKSTIDGEKVELNARNPFISRRFSKLSLIKARLDRISAQSLDSSLGFNTKNSWVNSEVKLERRSSNFEMWTKMERSAVFRSITIVSFEIINSRMESSALSTMNFEILTELLKLELVEKLYPSELLNYTWEIFPSVKGDARIGFSIKGLKDGMAYFLQCIVDALIHLCNEKLRKDEFRRARSSIRSRYKEYETSNSILKSMNGLLVVLEENCWTLEDRLESLDDIDFEEFEEFLQCFAHNGQNCLKLFIQGDFDSADEMSGIVDRFTHHLEREDGCVLLEEPSSILLREGANFYFEEDSSKDDPTNSLCYFLQTGGRDDVYVQSVTKLFAFLMARTLVPDLRFKRQLGYAVLGGLRILRSTVGLHVTVMSGNFPPKYLEYQIEEYLARWGEYLMSLSDEEFHKEVIEVFLQNNADVKEFEISSLLTGPESLTLDLRCSAGSANCDDVGECMAIHRKVKDLIMNNSYDRTSLIGFDYDVIKNLSRAEFRQFFETKISVASTRRRKLVIMIEPAAAHSAGAELRDRMIRLQLEALLKMNGLKISTECLQLVVEESNGNGLVLFKALFKHFRSQGESVKLCTVVLREVLKVVTANLKTRSQDYEISRESAGERIRNIPEFQQKCVVYRRA